MVLKDEELEELHLTVMVSWFFKYKSGSTAGDANIRVWADYGKYGPENLLAEKLITITAN